MVKDLRYIFIEIHLMDHSALANEQDESSLAHNKK